MRAKWLFAVIVLWIVFCAIVIIAAPEWLHSLWSRMPLAVVFAVLLPLFALLWRLYVSLLRPISAVSVGMDLLSAQDFSSRLVKVGQRDADQLVNMFNRMIDRLKEERLRSEERDHFMHLIIDSSPLGIAILDFDGVVTLINSSMCEFMELCADDVVVGKRIDEIDSEVAREAADIAQGDTRVVRRGNRILRIQRLDFFENGFRRPYILIESLTEEVLKAEKDAYGKVIRMISHEVNNTMAGVKSVLDALISIYDVSCDSDMREVIKSCSERCDGMSGFITRYADVVRIPEAKLVNVELGESVKGLLPFLESLAGVKVKIAFEKCDMPVWVRADMVLLEQVVVNIVKNSIESIGEQCGTVKLRVSSLPSTLDIEDNGAGISPDAEDSIFSPFFSTKRGGQGIGLTLVGEILSRHGCAYSLRTIDGITRFRIVFP